MSGAPKSMLYSRTGDDGTSALYTGERRSKKDPHFEALGHLDELNSVLGVAHHHCKAEANGLAGAVEEVQACLIQLMSHVATPRFLDELEEPDEERMAQVAFDVDGSKLGALERAIDQLDAQLPKLTKFILPSGGLASCSFHLARATCRRAERQLVELRANDAVQQNALHFVNRLSDFFFASARFAAHHVHEPEVAFSAAEYGEDNGFPLPLLGQTPAPVVTAEVERVGRVEARVAQLEAEAASWSRCVLPALGGVGIGIFLVRCVKF